MYSSRYFSSMLGTDCHGLGSNGIFVFPRVLRHARPISVEINLKTIRHNFAIPLAWRILILSMKHFFQTSWKSRDSNGGHSMNCTLLAKNPCHVVWYSLLLLLLGHMEPFDWSCSQMGYG